MAKCADFIKCVDGDALVANFGADLIKRVAVEKNDVLDLYGVFSESVEELWCVRCGNKNGGHLGVVN